MSAKKKIIFVSVDRKINDLEWKLPIIDEFIRAGYEVEVFLSLRFPHECDDFFIYVLNKIGAVVLYNNHLDFAEIFPQFIVKFLRMIGRNMKWGRLLEKVYFSSNSKIFFLKRKRYENALLNWFNSASVVFLCVCPENIDNALVRTIYETAQRTQAKTVGVPLVVGHIWYYDKNIRSCDLVLTSTMKERDGCAAMNPYPTECVGAAQFDTQWLQRYNNYYRQWDKEKLSCPQDKQSVLMILTSEIHPHWEGVDYCRTVSRLIEHVWDGGKNFIFIKPHPRNSPQILERIISNFPKDSYRLVYGAIAPLIEKVQYVISFISLGALFALPFKKIPYVYLPMSPEYKKFLDDGGGSVFKRLYLEKSPEGDYQTNFNDYIHLVDDLSFQFGSVGEAKKERCLVNFYRDFNPEGSAGRVRSLIEKLMESK